MLNSEVLQHKDGVLTERIQTGEGTAIRKTFENTESTREISNYRLLSRLNIPTLQVLSHSADSITLEDIAASDHWRLGTPADLSDPKTAASIARWYKFLHERGRGEVTEERYDESDLFTRENLKILPEFTKLPDHPVWNVLESHFDAIRAISDRLPKTITYNDFYWTNLAVSRNGREALMFDYNLMGKGYAYADIRNVTVSLSPAAAAAFLAEYGPADPLERSLDDILSPIITLILASRRETFPSWAKDSLKALDDLPNRIDALLSYNLISQTRP